MTAKGFCKCRQYTEPGDEQYWPPEGATWHYLCDKPVLTAELVTPEPCKHLDNQGQPYDPPGWAHATMHDDEAERIAEVFDEARAELDRGL